MAANLPSFSVVIPLYNKRDHIVRTLASVLDQTLPPTEVIVVDDGSDDGGADRIAAIGDPRINLIRQANAGEGAARNAGAARACGDWIALIDADDGWRRDHLATLAEVIAAYPDVDLIGAASLATYLGDLDQMLQQPSGAGSIARLDFFRDHDGSVFNASSVAIRRTAFAATSGFGSYRVGADTEFWIRFALDHKMAVSTRQSSIYLRGNGGVMERVACDARGRDRPLPESPVFATLERALASPRYRELHAPIRAYADRTRLNYARGRLYIGRGVEARAILRDVHQPARVERLVYQLLSYLPAPALRAGSRGFSTVKRLL
ncbi:glycosyltransferase family 2 protein [Sphingomonas qomolangmaensis]|uniref:Glycosyltransferase family 2 protein n=1 Tax=Sphingomonas qomolangmaensis TaxID=2918765 RepID=A0ABY5L9R4_9SPHN|nr:glycosyltransferase family 2 protein [Sphingomonas qomolangmaensis]UUL82469.1 glycosyltransferase family 2 protein [Sphingomonas qomolangmaensis]